MSFAEKKGKASISSATVKQVLRDIYEILTKIFLRSDSEAQGVAV